MSKQIKTETIEEFKKRGGNVVKLKTPRRLRLVYSKPSCDHETSLKRLKQWLQKQ